jgi:hypothetical protein
MIAHAVTRGSLAGLRTDRVATRGGPPARGGGPAPGEFGLVSLIVSSSSVGCDIPAWPYIESERDRLKLIIQKRAPRSHMRFKF